MTYLTRQEIFDKAVKGLASQGFVRSIEPGRPHPFCRYRGPNGLRCAIGWLIPDNVYELGVEGYGARTLIRKHGHRLNIRTEDTVFCCKLQEAHDDGPPPSIMRANLREVAEEYNLTIPPELDGAS